MAKGPLGATLSTQPRSVPDVQALGIDETSFSRTCGENRDISNVRGPGDGKATSGLRCPRKYIGQGFSILLPPEPCKEYRVGLRLPRQHDRSARVDYDDRVSIRGENPLRELVLRAREEQVRAVEALGSTSLVVPSG